MIKELVHDPIFLAQKSEDATSDDIQTAVDLLETLKILKGTDAYTTEEGCLSLLGAPRKTKRYKKIKVRYMNEDFAWRIKTFDGWTAQIIQHEIDHCNGVLI